MLRPNLHERRRARRSVARFAQSAVGRVCLRRVDVSPRSAQSRDIMYQVPRRSARRTHGSYQRLIMRSLDPLAFIYESAGRASAQRSAGKRREARLRRLRLPCHSDSLSLARGSRLKASSRRMMDDSAADALRNIRQRANERGNMYRAARSSSLRVSAPPPAGSAEPNFRQLSARSPFQGSDRSRRFWSKKWPPLARDRRLTGLMRTRPNDIDKTHCFAHLPTVSPDPGRAHDRPARPAPLNARQTNRPTASQPKINTSILAGRVHARRSLEPPG